MKISEQQFRQLLDRYLKKTASPEEREMLDRFFNSYGGSADEYNGDFQGDRRLAHEMLRNIHARLDLYNLSNRRPTLRRWASLAAAAALFLLVYFFIDGIEVWQETGGPSATNVEEKTTRGERLVTRLSDGTTVHLNADSKISYPKDFAQGSRDVNVSGEAYFEVVTNSKPFVVHTEAMKTQVLGTSFNVKSRQGEASEVTVVEGKVHVFSPSGKSTVLQPNEQAVLPFSSGDITRRRVSVMRFVSWKDNILYFEQTALKDAIQTLENWYDVTITIEDPAIERCVITAKYQAEPLGNVLSSLQFLLNLEIKRVHQTHYTIGGKGCK